jgi:succinate-acetate transporter protein
MKFANPAPLGLFAFGLTAWLLGMVNAGLFGANALPLVLAMAFAFGGATQFTAGLIAGSRGDTFGLTAFCGFGAFWLSWALFDAYFAAHVPAYFIGWYELLWAIFTSVAWIATFRANRALQYTFLCSGVTFYFLVAGEWSGIVLLQHLGGLAGLVTGLLAVYGAAAQLLDELMGSDVLPLGIYKKPLAQDDLITTAALKLHGILRGGHPPAPGPVRHIAPVPDRR